MCNVYVCIYIYRYTDDVYIYIYTYMYIYIYIMFIYMHIQYMINFPRNIPFTPFFYVFNTRFAGTSSIKKKKTSLELLHERFQLLRASMYAA